MVALGLRDNRAKRVRVLRTPLAYREIHIIPHDNGFVFVT